MPHQREKRPSSTATVEPDSSTVKCCLCHEGVSSSGFCTNCNHWPINVTPRRWDEGGHLVDQDGFCRVCLQYVLNQLTPGVGEWVDTRKVRSLLSRDENKRRIHGLVDLVNAKLLQGNKPLVARDIEAEKRAILDQEKARTAERVPF